MSEEMKITGETSDGYHTFNELYHHRTLLFAALCEAYRTYAWKSRHHADGTMYDGMFIVGIETPEGQATYHCDNEYWDLFNVREYKKAPEWDGHTPAQAIERISNLASYFKGERQLRNSYRACECEECERLFFTNDYRVHHDPDDCVTYIMTCPYCGTENYIEKGAWYR